MLKRGLSVFTVAAIVMMMAMAVPSYLARAEETGATPIAGEMPMPVTSDGATNLDSQLTELSATEEPATEHAGEHAADDIGFPQLKTDTYASQIFWLVVCFVALFTLMSKIALPRLSDVIDHRRTQKTGNLAEAEKLTAKAISTQKIYEKALAKAQSKAQDALKAADLAIKEKTAAREAAFAEQSRNRQLAAEQKILKAKADALQTLNDVSADVAADIVHKIAGISVNKADAQKITLAVSSKG